VFPRYGACERWSYTCFKRTTLSWKKGRIDAIY